MDINKMLVEMKVEREQLERSDYDPTTIGSRPRQKAWASASLDVANQAAGPSSRQQESTEGLGGVSRHIRKCVGSRHFEVVPYQVAEKALSRSRMLCH